MLTAISSAALITVWVFSEEDDKERLKIMEAWGRYCMEGKWPDEE